MTIELVVPVLPCATCAHAVVCAVRPRLEFQAGDWQLMPLPDPLISVKARLTVECAEYLSLAEVKPHVVLDRLLTGTWPPTSEQTEEPEVEPLEAEPEILEPATVAAKINHPEPTKVDLQAFALIRENPDQSYVAIARAVGMKSDANLRLRFNVLTISGTLPADIAAWRKDRSTRKGGQHDQVRKATRAEQSAKLGSELAQTAERVLGETPATDPDPILDRVHESLQPVVAEQFEAAAAVDRAVVVMPFPNAARTAWAPACKSPADWTMWREANARKSLLNRLDRPCDDCPLAYASEKLKQGRCNGIPVGGWPAVAQ